MAFALAPKNLQAGYFVMTHTQFTLPEQSDWCDNMPIRSYDYAPVLPVNVSRPYFTTRPQSAREKFGVWGRDYGASGYSNATIFTDYLHELMSDYREVTSCEQDSRVTGNLVHTSLQNNRSNLNTNNVKDNVKDDCSLRTVLKRTP